MRERLNCGPMSIMMQFHRGGVTPNISGRLFTFPNSATMNESTHHIILIPEHSGSLE